MFQVYQWITVRLLSNKFSFIIVKDKCGAMKCSKMVLTSPKYMTPFRVDMVDIYEISNHICEKDLHHAEI